MDKRMAAGSIKKLIKLVPFLLTIISLFSLIYLIFFILLSNFKLESLHNLLSDKYIQYVIEFTLWQSTLSTILAILLSLFIARALHRQPKFFGRKIILNFLNLSFILPSIILVIGIAIIHGKNGWINQSLQKIFHFSFNHYLYGEFGVLIGHLAFSVPLAVKIFLFRLESIPEQTWKLSTQLGFTAKQIFLIVEWPFLRSSVIASTMLIFIMCFSSFVMILTLGGGPAVNTIEVAIYQALKFEFDLNKAAHLALIQFIICSSMVLLIKRFNTDLFSSIEIGYKKFNRAYNNSLSSLLIDIIMISILLIISALPVVAIIFNGFNSRLLSVLYSNEFWQSAKQSLEIAIYSGILSTVIALTLISGAFYFKYFQKKNMVVEQISWVSNIKLIIPEFLFVTSLFLALNNYIPVVNLALYLIILSNAIASLPFIINILMPVSLGFTESQLHLCQNLGIKNWNFIKIIYLPKIRKTLAYTLALSVTLSWGDLGLIALFGNNELNTLPYLLYNMMGSYRMEEASSIALVILFLSFLLFWIIEEFLGGEQNVRT